MAATKNDPELKAKVKQKRLDKNGGVWHTEEAVRKQHATRRSKNGGNLFSEEARASIAAKNSSKEATAKRIQGRLEKNGGVYVSDEQKATARKTIEERYGVSHYMQLDEFKEKVKTSTIEAHGAVGRASPEIDKKFRQSMIERHGVEHALQIPGNTEIVQSKIDYVDRQAKIEATSLQNYGVKNPRQNQLVSYSHRDTEFKSNTIYSEVRDIAWWNENYVGKKTTMLSLCERFGLSQSFLCNIAQGVGVKVENWNVSRIEERLAAELSRFAVVEQHNRTLIKPKELDIYIPSHNLAIEVNGLYWHSEIIGGKSKTYHIDKRLACEVAGITLIQFWDVELKNNFDLCVSMIKSRLGLNKKVFARKCEIADVPPSVAEAFVAENHLSKHRCTGRNIGLFNEGEIVALGMFGNPRFSKDADVEIVRFCSLKGVTVVGGFQKILSNVDGSIVSYSDGRYSTGNVYQKSGFKLVADNDPTPWYTKNYENLFNRSAIMKKTHPDLTQWESAKLDGWDRVWDAGQRTWVLDKPKSVSDELAFI